MEYIYTKLYVEGLPVEYNIILKEGQFFFEPGYNPHEDLKAPAFIARIENSIVVFENLNDESLKHQAEEEIMEYMNRRSNWFGFQHKSLTYHTNALIHALSYSKK